VTGKAETRAIRTRIAHAAIRRVAPDLAREMEANRGVRDVVMPRDLGQLDPSPHVPARLIGCAGLDLRLAEQLERLARWRRAYPRVFEDLRSDPRINTRCQGKPYVHNGTYPTPDAEIYAAMVLDFGPRGIVEIGAGFSTRIARRAVRLLSERCPITVIDPEPRTDVAGDADELVLRPVEEMFTTAVPLGDRGLLFIDSSHVTRAGGDIPYLYNVLLPSLPAGTVVHVHDIFLPYDYPVEYQKRLYTEQYVLHALLAHAKRYRVLFASHCMSREHPDAMRETFGEVVARDDPYYGASFWFMVR
jgi:hypothetical protein